MSRTTASAGRVEVAKAEQERDGVVIDERLIMQDGADRYNARIQRDVDTGDITDVTGHIKPVEHYYPGLAEMYEEELDK